MTPDSMANGVEEQKLLLKQYLGQYYYAKMKKKQLEARLRTFRENMLGTKGMQYSPVPRSQTNSVGDGPATQVIRAMEIEDRIESQKAEMAKTMLNVMKIMDFLPTDSTERSILEYRHNTTTQELTSCLHTKKYSQFYRNLPPPKNPQSLEIA